MSGLDSIPVKVEGLPGDSQRTENLKPLLYQVEQALRDLLERGEETTIDLAAMPFSQQDEADLRAHLGNGEVTATLNAFGPTTVQETGLPGVWLVEHRDASDRRLTLHLEVTRVPAILVTPAEDIADGLAVLGDANAAEQAAQPDA